MSSLSRELVFLILQFLDEEKFKETVHRYVKIFFLYFPLFIIIATLTRYFQIWRGAVEFICLLITIFFLPCGDWSKNQGFSLT